VGVVVAEDVGGTGGVEVDVEASDEVVVGVDGDDFSLDIEAAGAEIGQAVVVVSGEVG